MLASLLNVRPIVELGFLEGTPGDSASSHAPKSSVS